jgi:hypothetical protein
MRPGATNKDAPENTMRFAIPHKPLAAWANRHRPALSAAGYALAFAVVFGGVALAAYHAGFSKTEAAVCGALALLFIRYFARSVPGAQRLIDRLQPPEQRAPAKPDGLPNWALAVYALIGLALITIIAFEETYTYAVTALWVGWIAGHHLLQGLLVKRDGTTAFGTAFIAFDERLDAWRDRHWAVLRVLGIALGFLLLFGGVALYAWQAGVTRVAGAVCGPACTVLPGFDMMVAAACGAAAVLFIVLYTRLTLAAQRVFIDPLKFVRPGPKPEQAAKWVTVLHVVLGFILLFVMTGVGQMQIPTTLTISGEEPEGAGMLLGWWIGGGIVLRFFWAQWRRGEIVTRGAGG